MQDKLKRLDSIVRNSYADQVITHYRYIEATKLLAELSKELRQSGEIIICPQCGSNQLYRGK